MTSTPRAALSPSVPSPYAERLSAIRSTEHSVEVAGSTTRFWIYGEEGAPTTLVAVHGFRGEHHGLEPVIAFLGGLTDGSLRVVAPDLPGFGESGAFAARDDGSRRVHSADSYAEWLADFLHAIGVGGDAVILGHSFGSIVTAAAVADGLPAAGLILVNPIAAPALSGPRGVFSRLAVFYYWAGAALPERLGFAALKSRLVTRVISGAMAKTKSKSLRSWIHDQHNTFFSLFADRQVVLEAFRASVSSDVSTYASRVSTRTLLIAADKDDVTALPAQYALQKVFPDAQLVVIHGVGHLIHYEKPREAALAVERFLS